MHAVKKKLTFHEIRKRTFFLRDRLLARRCFIDEVRPIANGPICTNIPVLGTSRNYVFHGYRL